MTDFLTKILTFAAVMVVLLLVKRAGLVSSPWDWTFHPWDMKVAAVLVVLYILYQCWWWRKHK